MFDDLHDPNQPEASMKTLADVTERARAIRRRRAAWTGGSAVVLVLAATFGVLAATRDDSKRIINVSPGPTDSAPTETSVPPVTDPPATTISDSIPPSTASATAVIPNPPETATTVDETIAPATVNGDSSSTSGVDTTTTIAETTTTAAPLITRPIVAINGEGDAVIVALDGTTTVLYDGPAPDDPPPAEGESYIIDAVAVTDDSSVALVGTCCEPVVGTVIRFALPDTTNLDSYFGHAPTLSPDGTKVAIDQLQTIAVADLNLTQIASTPDTFLTGTGNGFIWLDNQRFVVVEAFPDHVRLQAMTLGADNTLQAGPVWTSPTMDGFALTPAGTGPGVFYVHGITPATLTAFDAVTMQPVPASDVALPAQVISAWMQDGQLRWVGTDGVMHVGEAVVPGEYIWVR